MSAMYDQPQLKLSLDFCKQDWTSQRSYGDDVNYLILPLGEHVINSVRTLLTQSNRFEENTAGWLPHKKLSLCTFIYPICPDCSGPNLADGEVVVIGDVMAAELVGLVAHTVLTEDRSHVGLVPACRRVWKHRDVSHRGGQLWSSIRGGHVREVTILLMRFEERCCYNSYQSSISL